MNIERMVLFATNEAIEVVSIVTCFDEETSYLICAPPPLKILIELLN